MTDSIFKDIEEILSVSSGDALTVSGNSVSGNDSAPTNIYIFGMPQEESFTETIEEITYTLFDKPLQKYSVSEGLLLILVTLAVIAFIWKVAKGGFSWLGW